MAKERESPRLFKGDVPLITSVTREDESSPWAVIKAAGLRLGSVPFAQAAALGVVPGAAWTGDLLRSVARATLVLRAKLKAVKLLGIRARSAAELRERLVRLFEAPVVDEAIEELKREKLLDDAGLAAQLVEKDTALGRSSLLIERRLSSRGLERGTNQPPQGELERAIAAARNRAARLPESLGAAARYQRLLAALARLGYDEETAREAAATVLGPVPEHGDPDLG